jgi:uncharacterized membrane protein YeaQ/YmgE (transglycosylase-associated protein family)
MNFVAWLVMGGLLGWMASIVLGTDARQGAVMNIIVGLAGALLGGWIISPLIGGATINQGDFSVVSLLSSFIGAILLLGIASLLRRTPAK